MVSPKCDCSGSVGKTRAKLLSLAAEHIQCTFKCTRKTSSARGITSPRAGRYAHRRVPHRGMARVNIMHQQGPFEPNHPLRPVTDGLIRSRSATFSGSTSNENSIIGEAVMILSGVRIRKSRCMRYDSAIGFRHGFSRSEFPRIIKGGIQCSML
jgi:hypothetical protein